ncbi:MAG TPA: spermidine/putrescine ABC transporter substrate-binding protein [Burkholderiales bacterium]|nr:spermidine/putrescine ABC transporter substrate-binding protein [Burkholderiales bacterium]
MRLAKLLLVLAAVGLGACGKKDEVLSLYNWNQYIAPETVERFEKACGCKVQQAFYSDNSELMAKIAGGAKGYDVLVPTSNYVSDLANGGYLQPIEKSKLPNLKNIMPAYLDTEFDPGNQYSVPYAYTITMLGYNEEKLSELGVPVDSWALIFDPKLLEKIKGRVTVLDSPDELTAAALKYLGYSANAHDPAKLEEAKQVIVKAKPYWAAFKASGYIELLAAGDIWVAHGYSNDIYQADLGAQQAGKSFRIKHAMPKEGAVLALDAMVVAKDAPHPELAHRFIDFMLEGQNSADLTNMLGSGNPNSAAMEFIKPEIKSMAAVFPDAETAEKLEMLKPMDADQRRQLNQVWTEIKAE